MIALEIQTATQPILRRLATRFGLKDALDELANINSSPVTYHEIASLVLIASKAMFDSSPIEVELAHMCEAAAYHAALSHYEKDQIAALHAKRARTTALLVVQLDRMSADMVRFMDQGGA